MKDFLIGCVLEERIGDAALRNQGIQEFRNSEIQEFRNQGIHECRKSGIQESEVQASKIIHENMTRRLFQHLKKVIQKASKIMEKTIKN